MGSVTSGELRKKNKEDLYVIDEPCGRVLGDKVGVSGMVTTDEAKSNRGCEIETHSQLDG